MFRIVKLKEEKPKPLTQLLGTDDKSDCEIKVPGKFTDLTCVRKYASPHSLADSYILD